MEDVVMLPYYSLKPNSLTLYELPDKRHFSEKQLKTFENLEDNKNKYFDLSSHSRKRLKKAIEFLLYISKNKQAHGFKFTSKEIKTEIEKTTGTRHAKPINYKLTFITLTLSSKQRHPDEEIKSGLLNQFLVYGRKNWNLTNYIWKAEKQENENIHFHLLTDVYINHSEIRKIWNQIQNKEGFNYVDNYSKNMQTFFLNGFRIFENDKRHKKTQLKAYEENKKINWTNPNSTDIHSLYKVQNISAYMTMYLAKNVTKTSRTEKLEKLYSEHKIKSEQFALNEIQLCFSDDYENIQTVLKLEIDNLNFEIEELKNKGISGRIWAQSQSLSKLTAFTDMQTPENIPDIEFILNNYEYMNELDTGRSKVITYKFDIEKTKTLKKLLDNHILNSNL